MRQLLLQGGVREAKADLVLAVLAAQDVEAVSGLAKLVESDVDRLNLSVLHARIVKSLLKSLSHIVQPGLTRSKCK